MVYKPYYGVCQTTGKRNYATHKEAKAARRRLRDNIGVGGTDTYLCACGFHHVGGRHGEQSRIAHRTTLGTTPIREAAQQLGVNIRIIRLIIESGKARGNQNTINTQDLNQIQQRMWEQQ